MRVVIDTNVLVSGVINPHGAPGRIVQSLLAKSFLALHDDRILDEYHDVLRRPVFGFQKRDIEALLDFIEFTGEHISVRDTGIVLPDPNDLPFLEIAIAGRADALITGNLKHFKPKRGHHAVLICTPAEFIRKLPTARN